MTKLSSSSSLTQCRAIRNQRESPLLKLPAELRNRIYGYVLGRDPMHIHLSIHQAISLVPEQEYLYDRATPAQIRYSRQLLAITETCRQIHTEAQFMLFSLNEFYGSPRALQRGLFSTLTKTQYSTLNTIHILFTGTAPPFLHNELLYMSEKNDLINGMSFMSALMWGLGHRSRRGRLSIKQIMITWRPDELYSDWATMRDKLEAQLAVEVKPFIPAVDVVIKMIDKETLAEDDGWEVIG